MTQWDRALRNTAVAVAGCAVAFALPLQAGEAAPAASSTTARPSNNTGRGFFVSGGKLYDANGTEFRLRGVNRLHWDSDSQAGILNSGANAVRWNIDFTRPARANIEQVRSQSVGDRNVPIVANWTATCSADPAKLSSAVLTWVAQAREWTQLDRYLIVNVANEWGPADSTEWRDSYISAIASLRFAGYLGTVLIDSGGCGQDVEDLLKYSTAVFNSDPQKNVMFALHVYGNASRSLSEGWFQKLAALGKSAGMAFIIGEFGPGNGIGPSPTTVPPGQVISAAEAAGLGWLAWAWDDNNLDGCRSDDKWFSMTYACGRYSAPSDLTRFGHDVVLNPTYGIKALARPASIF